MEQKLDELLHNLHRYQFADAEQIVTELRHFILDRSHKEAELAFISSKIFNSQESLLQFLRQNSQMNERILSTVKKRIYELIIEYIKHRKQEVSGYLEQIKGTCMVSFLSDPNSLVREVSLLVLYKLIESYKETEVVIKPADLIIKLLDEIKLRNPAATVKGAIWQLVGLLHANYHKEVGVHIIESQDVQYQMLMDQIKMAKPEIKAIIGMLKGFVHSFSIECTLDAPQKNGLFLVLKTLMAPIQDVQNKGILKASMKLFSQHANLFTDQIMKQAMDLISRSLQLCTQDNIEVRDGANDMLGSLIKLVSDNLDRNKDQDIKLFKNIMTQFDMILDSNDFKNMQLLSAIRAVGIFSKAIQIILGDEKLWVYLQKLTELSEQKLIKEFMEQDKPESDLHNFKYILKKQKQLIAYIESYSFIIRNLNQEPSEKFRLHFMRVGSIGVNNHRKLYVKYRSRFYESLAQLTMSLSNFENSYKSWIKMFVRDSLTETLKIPDSVIYGGESPAESLEDAVIFWKEYIGKDQIWTEVHCRKLYDQLIDTCLNDILDLDLSYKVERTEVERNENSEEGDNDRDMQHSYSNVEYIANNSNDQQYLIRLTNFLQLFIPASYDQWLLKFVPQICQILVRKATQAPRIPKLYVLLQVVLEICSKYKYFETQADDNAMIIDQLNTEQQQIEDIAKSDKNNTYNMLLTFLKDLIGKSEEFQDELLESSLSLLLKVPIVIIHQNASNTDNLYLWKGVMIKALGLSQLNNKLALNCINTLEIWFNALPVSLVAELYSDVLPKLSNFLQIDFQSDGQHETYFFQDLIKDTKEVKIDRREIANKVVDLLGKIGGHAHQIINNELTKNHDKENFIRWDSEKRLKLTIPLNQRKIDIYLDSCLPRIIDIAKSSTEKKTRIAACELLHGLVLYMIGKSATKPKDNKINRTAIEQEKVNKAAFAKLYANLFPVIIRLATEIEEISRQLFEPLIFQIVRWFSSSKVDEHAEVESLLDALIEGSQSRNNSALREICCNAVAVFAQWSLKQSTDQEIRNIPVNIRSLLRRIESNSNHPDPFRRLSSVLCFGKILTVIKDFDPLVDRFCLEITRNVLSSLKQCHNSLEFSQDVIDTCSALLLQTQKLIVRKMDILNRDNPKRSVHTSLTQFQDFLFVRFTAVETVYRREAIKLWEGLLAPLGKQAIFKTVITRYVPQPDERPLWNISLIKFNQTKENNNNRSESKKQLYLEYQTQMDTLSAQIEFLNWLIQKAQFKYSELNSKLKIDLKVVKTNISSYLLNRVDPCFEKSVQAQSLQSLLACKEDREQVTKSNMRLLTQLYQLIGILQDYEVADLITQSNSSSGGSDEYLFDLAVQIILIPSAHRLNLLVQDYELESQLRRPCELYIERTIKRIKQEESSNIDTKGKQLGDVFVFQRVDKLQRLMPLIDLERLIQNNINKDEIPMLLHPRLLSSLLIGHIKIANHSQTMKNNLIEICDKLGPTVESWIQSDTPTYIESSRLVVSFMSQLRIPNETLFNWLTSKSFVYQKTSDLLLTFISENWTKEKVHLGEYLIQKATVNLNLLAVFLPIIEYSNTNGKANLKDVLIKQIPQNWQSVEFETEFAEKQVQIYYHIVYYFKKSFEDISSKEQVTFISFIVQQARNFLSSVKHNIYFKRQVLRLVGLLYSLKLSQDHISIHTRMKTSLENFLHSQLPIVSRDLASNKNEVMNYEQLIQGYLDLLDLSKSSQIVQLLYRVICEHKPMYLAEKIKASLNNFIVNVMNDKYLNYQSFFPLLDQFLTQFFDQSYINPDDNLRWAIANKILNRILETCSKERLQELFLNTFATRFRPSLDRDLAGLSQFDLYNAVREKTHVLLMLEIFVRRLDQTEEMRSLREKSIYPNGDGREINRYLINTAKQILEEDLGQFDQRCSQVRDKIQLPELNSLSHVCRRYACAGYTLLSSAIIYTQVRQPLYENNLFSNWEKIIDVSNESLYQFDILTNFNSVSLDSIEAKMRSMDVNYADLKSKIFLNAYTTSSFMQTNQKFNSAMVFETQIDQGAQKDNVTLVNQLAALVVDNPTGKEPEKQKPKVENKLELDYVNKHECMKNIKRVLDRMQELFQKEWTNDNLPKFMQSLLMQINGNSHLNIKIFILKLLINNPDVFKQYADHWLEPICNYMIGKQKNGKGFHYFHRDLVTLLILWTDSYTVTQEKAALLSKVINTIIRLAADKQKQIFKINIEMLTVLISKWKAVVVIEKEQLVKMLTVPDATEGSHLWKMTAIQVIALACSFNLPIRNINDHSIQKNHECRFIEGGNAHQMDPLLEALLKCQGMSKKQLIFASSEALGKVLKNQPTLAAFVLPFIMQNDVKEKHDVIVNVIERITREYPLLLAQRRIFLKLLSYINNLTGSMRSAIFKSLTRYFVICSAGEKKDITDTVKTICEDVLSDTSEENQLSFLEFVFQVIRMDKRAGAEILEKVADRLKSVYISNKNEAIRSLFYDLMVYLYDLNDEFNFKAVAKSSLIRGLSDSSQTIQEKLLEYWNQPTRLSNDPFERMEQLLTVLYDQEEEPIWLNNAVLLLMQVSKLSGDFSRKIFEDSLRDCKFQPLVINQYQLNSNRSQPVTSSLAMIFSSTQQQRQMQLDQKKKTLMTSLNTIQEKGEQNTDVEMKDEQQMDSSNTEMIESQGEHLKVAGQHSLASNDQSLQPGQGQFVRATLEPGQPLFTHRETIQSSLFPGTHSSSPGQSQAFYRNQGQRQISMLVQIAKDDFKDPTDRIYEAGRTYNPRQDQSVANLLTTNGLSYNPVTTVGGNVRIQTVDGQSKPSTLARKEQNEIDRKKIESKLEKERNKMEVKLIRKYRQGEIPDIEIPYSDLLLPLMALVRKDSTIATEIMVELFTQVYKENQLEGRKKLGSGIKGILQQSIKFDYGIINTSHRIAIELLKTDGFSLDPEVVERTGRSSMSFQTSLLLLEETLLKNEDPTVSNLQKSKAEKPKKEAIEEKVSKVTEQNKSAWFSLIQLYELVGNEDALKGIWCNISSKSEVMLKKGLRESASVLNSISLIKQAQIKRTQGNIRQGLNLLEDVIQSSQFQQIFEEQVQLELMNKKYESFSELSKWDKISNLSIEHHQGKQLYDIPFYQAETMIRSQLRCSNQWGQLLDQVQSWQSDPTSKLYLEKRFNYEQAMLHITSGDFDRARFYISKDSNDLLSQWKDLTKLSQVAQHFLVQKIQKIYEMKEFLQTTKQLSLKNFDELAPEALLQMQNWVQRQPNYSFDKLNVWDDILTARMLYMDQYKLNFKKNSDFNNQLEGRVPTRFKDIQNIGAILYTQSAKGALRMGLLDSSNTYLLKALEQRSDGDQKNNLRVVVPIIKLNIEQVKQQTSIESWGFEQRFAKYGQVLTTLDAKINKDQSNDVVIQIKATVLKLSIHKKLLSLLLSDMKTVEGAANKNLEFEKIRQNQINDQVSLAFSTHQRVEDLIKLGSVETKQSARAKSLFHFSKLCDKLLRDSENEDTQKKLDVSFKKVGFKRDGIAKLCIRNAFNSINMGYLRARDIIPRLLDLVSKHDNAEIDQEFISASKDTPAWIFIRWISQLAAVINKRKSEVIDEKIVQISKKYPQAMFYPFNVLESNLRINILDESVQTTQLFKKTKKYFEDRFQNLFSWTQALEGLVHPEQRFQSWIRLIEDAVDKCRASKNRSRVDLLLRLMIEDVGSLQKRFIGKEIGDYNKKFVEDCSKPLLSLENKKLNPETLLQQLQGFKIQVSASPLSKGEVNLSQFSEYLVNLDNNDFYNPEIYLEIPGQYDNQIQEPILDKNVKIASIKKSLLILPSIMKPKRITVHGSNEKDFNLLIKGGEDLRLDQRIQQLFQIINGIFQEDSNCQSRNFNLKTFGIVPITNNLGSLQWIDDTEPLKVMIDREHQRVERGTDLSKCAALQTTLTWLAKVTGKQDNVQRHVSALSLDAETVSDAFIRHKQMMKWSLLRNGLENLCLTSSAFITIKNQFIKSIAVFSIVSYLLGIGDRHLENFLVNTTDGEVLGIDFGCSFGAGVQLAIPELVPFRLTQQIEGVIAPHTNDGIYKQTMVHVLNALRKKKNIIFDTCDIFVKEPLLDWLKKAQKAQQMQGEQQTGNNDMSFYPKQKINVLKQKLNGQNPVRVMILELNDSVHKKRPYYNQLVLALKGPAGSVRSAQFDKTSNFKTLTVEEQVENLIELARDPNILGRTWIGWGAYI